MLLNIELKQLYTAITRAKVNLWIYESEPIDEHGLPILAQWRKGFNGRPLVEIVNLDFFFFFLYIIILHKNAWIHE